MINVLFFFIARICSKHFHPSCYTTKTLQQQMLGYSPSKVRKLHPNAIPTLYISSTVLPSASSSSSSDVQEVLDESILSSNTSSNSNPASSNSACNNGNESVVKTVDKVADINIEAMSSQM